MAVDWSFRLSDLLVILGFLGTTGLMFFRAGAFTQAIKGIQSDVRALEASNVKMADAITQIAIQRNDIDHMREDIEDLRRGRGYIQHEDRVGMDGEYTGAAHNAKRPR